MIGAELLKSIKKHTIENNSWADFARLKHVLAGQKPDREELRTLQLLWTGIVKRLHVRIYQIRIEPILTERIEQLEHLVRGGPTRTEQEKHMKTALEGEYHRIREEYNNLSEAEKEQERQQRRTREKIRADRLQDSPVS